MSFYIGLLDSESTNCIKLMSFKSFILFTCFYFPDIYLLKYLDPFFCIFSHFFVFSICTLKYMFKIVTLVF